MVNPHLQVGTSMIQHGVECRRMKMRKNMCGKTSNHGGIYMVVGGNLNFFLKKIGFLKL
jgi:hypothetical protein